MAKILDAYLHEHYIGQLIQDNDGEVSFTYAKQWLENPNAVAISCSLPLQPETFNRKKCSPFFEGILPEHLQRKIIAKNLGISERNDFSMLEKIGGECAGALTFIPAGQALNVYTSAYHKLTENELSQIFKELPAHPLLAGEPGIRLSLAGVQNKLAVYVKDKKLFIPLHNSPSTHILKPAYGAYNDIIFNEYFCLTLANLLGLPTAKVEIKKAEDIDYLLIERYDRLTVYQDDNIKKVKRLHQEDFCQALGIPTTKKYQNEEGPSLKMCFELLRDRSSIPVLDLDRLLNAVILNYLIGNCDAHGKNFSILYTDKTQLAPLYDLVCTLYYENLEKKMAMKLGGEYNINKIRLENFDRFSEEIGFTKPEVRKRLFKMSDDMLSVLSKVEIQHPSQEIILDIIKKRCEHFSRKQA